MKKIVLITFLFALVQNFSNAQYLSKLKMNYEGNFTTQDGKAFDVVTFEEKGATVSHTYAGTGEYTVELTVSDGKTSSVLTRKITVAADKCTQALKAAFTYEVDTTLQKTFKAKGIFSKDGVLSEKPKKRQTVTMLEDYFNGLINRIINGDDKANEDW